MEEYDIAVIGAGPGGYPAAIRAAQLGASVALVEKEKLGGVCLNWGCIPTKALLASAGLWRKIKNASDFGVTIKDARFDYGAASRRKDEVVKKLGAGVASLLKTHNVKLFSGTASFAGRNLLDVEATGGAKNRIKAGRVIIATGSKSVFPANIPQSPLVMDSRGFLESNMLPESILIVGGGVIGCELACLCAAFGVRTTVIELMEDVLPQTDADLRRELRRGMEKELGITLITGAAAEKVSATENAVTAVAAGKKITADRMLVAVGRKAAWDGLMPETAGLRPDSKGCIPVNDKCETEIAGIYAVGDVTGFAQLAHSATAQGFVAAENACGLRASIKGRAIPSCIFTIPEICAVGISEQEAEKQGIKIKVAKFHFAALGRALAQGTPEGFVKLVAREDTGQLIGAAAVGEHAVELAAEAGAAIDAELTAHELGAVIHAHPTMSEAWLEAAHMLSGSCVHAPPQRKTTPQKSAK